MTNRTFFYAVLAAALTTAGASGQEQPATFRSSVDLVRVDVNVLDHSGKSVTGLGAGDFSISVDGKTRRVVSAEYVATSQRGTPAAAPPKQYSTNAASTSGRLIMIVVDQGTIPPGRARSVLNAADEFVARLNPGDRVGLVTIPSM